jgi:hypothetical protein
LSVVSSWDVWMRLPFFISPSAFYPRAECLSTPVPHLRFVLPGITVLGPCPLRTCLFWSRALVYPGPLLVLRVFFAVSPCSVSAHLVPVYFGAECSSTPVPHLCVVLSSQHHRTQPAYLSILEQSVSLPRSTSCTSSFLRGKN